MQNRTCLFIIVISILAITFLTSCQKFETNEEIKTPETEISLKDVNFNPAFNWETSKTITLSISSTKSQILNITSTDQLIRYHKGILTDPTQAYIVKLSVATSVKKLSVNNQEFDLNSENISISL